MFYQSLVSSLQVLGLYLPPPPILLCKFSTVSSTDIFIFIPPHSYHHFIISKRSTYRGQKPFICEIVSPDRTASRKTRRCRVFRRMMLIICVRSFERVRRSYLHVCVYSAVPQLHVTTHKFKSRMKKKKKKKEE